MIMAVGMARAGIADYASLDDKPVQIIVRAEEPGEIYNILTGAQA